MSIDNKYFNIDQHLHQLHRRGANALGPKARRQQTRRVARLLREVADAIECDPRRLPLCIYQRHDDAVPPMPTEAGESR